MQQIKKQQPQQPPLATPVQYVKGVGPALSQKLARIGIFNVGFVSILLISFIFFYVSDYLFSNYFAKQILFLSNSTILPERLITLIK